MNNKPAKEETFIHNLSQDELLRKIEHEYTTSAAAKPTVLGSDQSIEDTNVLPLSILELTIGSETEEKVGEEQLHFRNQAQVDHTVNTEKSAIAHWAK